MPLTVGRGVEASRNNGTIFTYNPTATGVNANTKTYIYGGTERWYYNWYAATAEKDINATDDVDGSICPKGWKLPYNYTISDTVSWGALTNAYNITTNGTKVSTLTGYLVLEAYPLSLLRSGLYYYGTFSAGASGVYWSSTASDASSARDLDYNINSVDPQSGFSKPNGGLPIRCLASPLVH